MGGCTIFGLPQTTGIIKYYITYGIDLSNIVHMLDEMIDFEKEAYDSGECSLEHFKSRKFISEEDATWTILVTDDSLECNSWYDKVVVTRRDNM
jgi:hypothetical protein